MPAENDHSVADIHNTQVNESAKFLRKQHMPEDPLEKVPTPKLAASPGHRKKSGAYQNILVRTALFTDWVLSQSLCFRLMPSPHPIL